jgi:hypothetical protein
MKKLFLTYSEDSTGISGHIYEVIDYFIKLKQFSPTILLLHQEVYNQLEQIIKYKYDLDKNLYNDLVNSTKYYSQRYINNFSNDVIISTNGKISSGRLWKCNSFVGFKCSSIEKFHNFIVAKQKYILEDFRVYNNLQVENMNLSNFDYQIVDYNKKIFYKYIKKPISNPNKTLLYLTKSCKEYNNYMKYKNTIIVSDYLEGNNVLEPPVDDLFSKFDTYIYTPVSRKFDCSNRLIKECQYFNKKVILDIDYIDKALEVRFHDSIDNTDLDKDNFIINFIGNLLC